ncbi:AfsA-related hotdog domain-containing protein [Microbulbifer sp. 2205BS26-8]|uniref:AfsA-related hotdog domain-containing protein n=1 Tax=Microbulbifer sp. 2205BS26-8 TaxID=3064386 RepID=UPI00273FFE7A|nr:AfsA-related hotdog domain-containing protein [Microbulbifer sp. 2205BS26-8]MDP5211014.1 AfsA-related hotdog domain-containing protein [Microbulbifer sp. 2205BS26-8]
MNRDTLNRDTLIIVGNRFKAFAQSNFHVITVNELKDMAQQDFIGSYDIHLGQGVSSSEFLDIQEIVNQKSRSLNLLIPNDIQDLACDENQSRVHKHNKDNIMISAPVRKNENNYCSKFYIQDGSAELSDHMTGQHIQGMALIEAARQMMLSVSEEFLLDDKYKYKSYFVLNEIHVAFKQFVFPVECQLDYEICDYSKNKNGTIKGTGISRFHQNGQLVTQISIQFTAYQETFIQHRESELARVAIENQVNTLREAGPSIAENRKFNA